MCNLRNCVHIAIYCRSLGCSGNPRKGKSVFCRGLCRCTTSRSRTTGSERPVQEGKSWRNQRSVIVSFLWITVSLSSSLSRFYRDFCSVRGTWESWHSYQDRRIQCWKIRCHYHRISFGKGLYLVNIQYIKLQSNICVNTASLQEQAVNLRWVRNRVRLQRGDRYFDFGAILVRQCETQNLLVLPRSCLR